MLVRAEGISPLCGLDQAIGRSVPGGDSAATRPRAHAVDVPVYTSAEYERLLDDFRRRLEAIVAYAERIGALPVLIVPPANDADFEPSRSFLDARRGGAA